MADRYAVDRLFMAVEELAAGRLLGVPVARLDGLYEDASDAAADAYPDLDGVGLIDLVDERVATMRRTLSDRSHDALTVIHSGVGYVKQAG